MLTEDEPIHNLLMRTYTTGDASWARKVRAWIEANDELRRHILNIEIYVPQARRQYGYYVLPILHGDRAIGRIDPVMDRKRGKLTIDAVYTEPDTWQSTETAHAVKTAVEELAGFLGATAASQDRACVGCCYVPPSAFVHSADTWIKCYR